MLASMRSGAGNKFAKVLLGLLVLSFALWGIEDIFRSTGANSIAKVDGTPIPLAEFQQQLNRQMSNYRRMLGSNYSPELVASMGIPQQILDGMIARELMRKETTKLHLSLDDKSAFAAIRANPLFQSERGEFDKQIFQMNIDGMGISQRAYIDETRISEAGRLILGTLLDPAPPPALLIDRMREMRNERRSAKVITLSPASLSAGDPPTEEELQNFYRDHLADFTLPETRMLSYAVLDSTSMPATSKPDEKEIAYATEERLSELRKKEKRTLEHLLFKTEQAATTAYGKLSKGVSFETLTAEGIENKGNTKLGTLTQDEVPENAGATVFALKEKGFTKPYESSFGWHIFYVRAIESAKLPEKAALTALVKEEMLRRKLEENLPALTSSLEDALAGGATLEEAAEIAHLKIKTAGPVTAKDGKTALPAGLLENAFTLGEKETSSLIPGESGSYYLVRADKVTAARPRPFEEVKAEIARAWQQENASSHLEKKADGLQQALESGETPEAAAVKYRAAISNVTSISRTGAADKTLSPALLQDLFTTSTGKATPLRKLENGNYTLAVVTDIQRNAAPSTTNAQENEKLAALYARELAGQYLSHLHALYPVHVDSEALSRATANPD